MAARVIMEISTRHSGVADKGSVACHQPGFAEFHLRPVRPATALQKLRFARRVALKQPTSKNSHCR
ncbi:MULTISPECIES: hypothetical protein [Streptomyces]|uniref:Uncharacterized protein n=1 Tax=Streptomyces antimycoticus TaxID=68175 RepID=A0ABD5J7H7_9ACTN|nr:MULTISPECIES: hypothetical protein [Streptomyces]MEE4583909.1 hypothetical protein [Streptomyces sp. DSM 41602]QTI88792.1 hypothetical protein AS97_49835 [Streptomyces sp. AgN23]RSS49783.1 hypothetical protein EF902_00395 [Streptomyces sp. WAC05858]WTA82370.1 hypothetical protein OG751_22090 [Streptomyces antimycoticus]WTB07105.1 hypothetical protein OG546_24570 [Streptomyces antimycoticus]